MCIFKRESGTEHDAKNESILSDIFLFASQMGHVPVLVCGDFQKPPLEYESVRLSQEAGWTDPLTTFDDEGNAHRPITFSKSSLFDDESLEYCTSIDGILLNPIALAALVKMETVYTFGKQHAPIRAEFTWPTLKQEGYVWDRPARFCPEKLNNPDKPLLEKAIDLWPQFQDDCQRPDSVHAWNAINDYAVQTLQHSGVSFVGKGEHCRARHPAFTKLQICPKQSCTGEAYTRAASALERIHGRICEPRLRIQREPTGNMDLHSTNALAKKLERALNHERIKVPSDFSLTDPNLVAWQKRVQKLLQDQRQREKKDRIVKWRSKMKKATENKNVGKTVYAWIKNKTRVDPPNIVIDSEGNAIYSPIDIMKTIDETWDDIFSSNVGHQDPSELLRFIWPYIAHLRNDATVPSLTGQIFRDQALSRNPAAAGGMDGWTTKEAQALPLPVFEAVAKFFEQIEISENYACYLVFYEAGDAK